MFTFVRVQLHETPSDYYQGFHEAMTSQGFRKQVTLVSGEKRKLPWGLYLIEEKTASDALLLAQKAVQSIGQSARFVSMQCADVRVDNLEPDQGISLGEMAALLAEFTSKK